MRWNGNCWKIDREMKAIIYDERMKADANMIGKSRRMEEMGELASPIIPMGSSWCSMGMPRKDWMGGKVGGRSCNEFVMLGDLDVIASVMCVANSNVILGRLAFVLKDMM